MPKKLLILSDLWGEKEPNWLLDYTRHFEDNFHITFYDSCELANVDKSDYERNKLHGQFVNGGIEKAVEKLISREKDSVNILAFSIGGTIAWKYALKTGNVDSLVCLSSTRLRYETIKPKGNIDLYFGEVDKFKPSNEWFRQMNINPTILKDNEHEFYMSPSQTFIDQILISLKSFSL